MTTEPKPQYPPFSEKGYALMNKWSHFDKCRYPKDWPIERRTELVIRRDQIPEFLENLKKLRIGIVHFQHWICINQENPNEDEQRYAETHYWDTANIGKGEPGWIDYSIDYVIAYLRPEHPKPFDYTGVEGTPGYREIHDVEALAFNVDLYGEYPDTPGPVEMDVTDDEWADLYRKYPDLFNQQ